MFWDTRAPNPNWRPGHVAARHRCVATHQALQLGEGHHGTGDLGSSTLAVIGGWNGWKTGVHYKFS